MIELRRSLRYDPVFLELGRRLGGEKYGPIKGCGAYAAVPNEADHRQVLAFLFLQFGPPSTALTLRDPKASLAKSILVYPGFALSLDCVAIRSDQVRGSSLTGSVACAAGFFEFRWGTERVLSYAPDEDHYLRLSLPEGDGAFYSAMDGAAEDSSRLISGGVDAASMDFAERLGREGRWTGGGA